MRKVLNIDIDDELFALWRSWYCPGFQMFRAEGLSDSARDALTIIDHQTIPLSISDTFGANTGEWGTITEEAFRSLSPELQTEILATYEPDETDLFRWPSTPRQDLDEALIAYVLEGASPSRHDEVTAATWDGCANLLPQARRLAGTFARNSGPNCFGNVMAAAGEDVELDHVLPDQLEEFLARKAIQTHNADLSVPAVVLVWRKADGRADHACVTLGAGWVHNKPAQAWWAPRNVWTVETTLEMESSRGAYETWQLTQV